MANLQESSTIPSWVIESGVEDSFRKLPYAIAIVSTAHGNVGLYANPTDQRCYRMIARVLVRDRADMRLNQIQSLQESIAVSTVAAVWKQVLFARTGLFVQSLHLGNNSMQQQQQQQQPTDAVGGGGDVQLGNEHEPYFYHEHWLARGDPDRIYFSCGDAPALRGPPLGTAFGAQDGGSVRPTESEMKAIVHGLRKILRESRKEDAIWNQNGCSVDTLD